MFADPSYDTVWAPSSRRGWTTLVSFTLQTVGVGVLLFLPLIYNEAIPAIKLASLLAAPLPPPGPPPAPSHPRGPRDANEYERNASGDPHRDSRACRNAS